MKQEVGNRFKNFNSILSSMRISLRGERYGKNYALKISFCCPVDSGLQGQEQRQRDSNDVADKAQFKKGVVSD